ncbi:hypothetical protein EJB05_28445, partial [Eragrostis curvula]
MVATLEVRWSGIAFRNWWRNQQFWMVSATSAYLAVLAQLALKVAAGKKISFMLTAKQTAAAGAGGTYRYAELYAVRLTALMVPPMFGAGDERGVHSGGDRNRLMEGRNGRGAGQTNGLPNRTMKSIPWVTVDTVEGRLVLVRSIPRAAWIDPRVKMFVSCPPPSFIASCATCSFRFKDCGEPIPSATVLPRLLEKLFDGEHPYASFLPPHTVALLHPAAAPQLE